MPQLPRRLFELGVKDKTPADQARKAYWSEMAFYALWRGYRKAQKNKKDCPKPQGSRTILTPQEWEAKCATAQTLP